MSSPRALIIQSKGIYHGLPIIPPNTKGLRAIVAGASGISGQHMIEVLGESPERWENVYAISRRLPMVRTGNLQHISSDLLSPPEEIAAALRHNNVQAWVTAQATSSKYRYYFIIRSRVERAKLKYYTHPPGICSLIYKQKICLTDDIRKYCS
ncbi:hypothetical protein V1509DRAFT_382515 [Lipomyces kononenkoae]